MRGALVLFFAAIVSAVDDDLSLLQRSAAIGDDELEMSDEINDDEDIDKPAKCKSACYKKNGKMKRSKCKKRNCAACIECPATTPPTVMPETPAPTFSPTPNPTPSPTPNPTPSPTPVPTDPPYVEHMPVSYSGWVNEWDRPMEYDCGGNQVLTGAYSVHDNGKEDRRWKLSCSSFAAPPAGYQTPYLHSCGWSDNTAWDGAWTTSYGSQYVIAGVKSQHDNGKEDRQYSFKACAVANVAGTGIRSGMSGWQNNWDGPLEMTLPATDFFGDWKSHHDNGKEDRQFAFDLAKFRYIPA